MFPRERTTPTVPKIVKSPLTIIVVLLAFTLASFWALIAWKGTQERSLAFENAGSETRGLTHSLAQHASKSFNAVALALFGASQYVQHSDRSARASAEIDDLLAQFAKNIPQVREIGVLAANGDWMYSSFETIPTVNNADRDYFRYHRSHPEDPAPHISDPLISRVTGRPTLLMTQPSPIRTAPSGATSLRLWTSPISGRSTKPLKASRTASSRS